MTAQPIKDEEGKIAGAVLTLHDITEQQASAKRLRDLSATDELTGLLNRRGFLEFARPKIDAARQEKQPVGLLFADMNGLKRINDELGHDQGDRAIADAAAVLRGVFRDGDVIARLGGDEFVALLPNMPPTAGEALLSRLAASVRAHSGANVRPYRLSLSAGVTFFDWSADDALEGVLARADQLMYQRKRTRASLSAIRLPEGGT